MNSPRRSLSASFGSWAVQLVYNPRGDGAAPARADADEVAVRAQLRAQRALWPAFFAMLLAVGAACYALAHFIALPFATRALMATLAGVFCVAWGARCAPPALRRICVAARWPLALVLTACALSLRWSEQFAPQLADEPNLQAAVFCGFIALLSVLLIGARSGGRLVPVAAPLVPALSLLGLLCLGRGRWHHAIVLFAVFGGGALPAVLRPIFAPRRARFEFGRLERRATRAADGARRCPGLGHAVDAGEQRVVRAVFGRWRAIVLAVADARAESGGAALESRARRKRTTKT